MGKRKGLWVFCPPGRLGILPFWVGTATVVLKIVLSVCDLIYLYRVVASRPVQRV